MTWHIIESELIKWLESYDGPRYHAVLSDPPYALISITKRFGKEGSAPAQEGSDGRYSRLSGGFMGQRWDGFDSLAHYQDWVAEWSDLLISNALYPGAVCLFFGGTRTFHQLGVGLERGGFEIIDCLMWLHGQGFPKSHNIVKGYGTALKPAWEPIYLCRAPRDGKTFAQLAVEYGTGALNIDGSRIGYEAGGDLASNPSKREKIAGGMGGHVIATEEKRRYMTPHMAGRWPTNLILSHAEDCVKVGEYEVKGRVINRWKDGMLPFGGGAGREYETIDPSRAGESSADRTYEDEGGTNFAMKPGARRGVSDETVDLYACVPGCPVRVLDDQVGELSSGLMKARTTRSPRPEHAVYSGVWEGNATNQDTYADAGGPSRFFYTAKASRSEKDKGLEDFYWKRTNDGFVRINLNEYEQLDKQKRAQGCIHPTVKPLELLRYLSTLSLPPQRDGKPRRILIPFSGSGSEMIGAIQAGWDEIIGVEMESNYAEMAEARLIANIGMF